MVHAFAVVNLLCRRTWSEFKMHIMFFYEDIPIKLEKAQLSKFTSKFKSCNTK